MSVLETTSLNQKLLNVQINVTKLDQKQSTLELNENQTRAGEWLAAIIIDLNCFISSGFVQLFHQQWFRAVLPDFLQVSSENGTKKLAQNSPTLAC